MKSLFGGFSKWLISTKFQVTIITIGLIFAAQGLYKLNPATAGRLIRDIALAYLGARGLEPIVEYAVARLKGKRDE